MNELDIHASAKALHDLRRDDGTLDVQARAKALDEIADSLTYEEIRRLRTRLNGVTFNKDICLDLPVELLLHVAEYLDFEDLMNTHHVSRSWRDKFTSPDFLIGIVKEHFRTKWEQSDLSDPTTKERLVNWFSKAAMKRLRSQRGQYLSRSTYHYQRGGTLLPSNHTLEHQYDSGRVAYRFSESIVVQSLKQGELAQPKVCMEANRIHTQSGKWLLSDEFLIVQFSQLNILAWSLINDDPPHRVRLPSPTKFMSARHKQVAMITKSNELLLWTVGGSLTSLQQSVISKSELPYWSPEAILFHPLNEGHFFVFYHDLPVTALSVQEFIHGEYQRTHRTDFGSDGEALKNLDLRIVRLVDDGLCIIGWDISIKYSKAPREVKTFSMYTYEFGNMPCPSPILPPIIDKEARSMRKQDVRIGPFEVDFSFDRPLAVENSAAALYDDNFVIVFGDYGYVVWCFDEDIKLPLAGSLSDKSMELQPAARPLPLTRHLSVRE